MKQGTLRDFEVVDELSPGELAVYRSVELEGCTPTEVAKRSGRQPTTVRTLLYRARKKRGDL